MHDGADVVHIQRLHLLYTTGGVLEGDQTHIKVDLIQVATVKRIQL